MKTKTTWEVQYNNSDNWLYLPMDTFEESMRFTKAEIKWLKHARIVKIEKTVIKTIFDEDDVK